MSIIGPQHPTIHQAKRQKRYQNPHHRYMNVDILQSNTQNNHRQIPLINDHLTSDHSTHHPLEASFTSESSANAIVSISIKKIRDFLFQ